MLVAALKWERKRMAGRVLVRKMSSLCQQSTLPFDLGMSRLERFIAQGETLSREVISRDGTVCRSTVQRHPTVEMHDVGSAFEKSWLMLRSPPPVELKRGSVRLVDLFSGCGGLTLGVREAARALNLDFVAVLANDLEEAALRVYERNFPGVRVTNVSVESLFDGGIGDDPTETESKLASALGPIDLVVAGPPCQGHSDLNNHTRRTDPKNELYMRVARCCEILRPRHVVIENVPGVLHDRRQVAQRTWQVLRGLGYSVSTGNLDALNFGAAQRRKRNFTLASRMMTVDVSGVISAFSSPARSLRWAIGDLESLGDAREPFDTAPEPKEESIARINFLFDRGLFDLPDSERPDCHRLKEHSYRSMYGRMHYDRPAQTITTGFGVMGRGRYVHPACRRTITPHEAARIQGFPDFFSFEGVRRTQLHMLIGNAVPSRLGYAVGGYLLR